LPIFVQLTKSMICTYDVPGKPTLDAYPANSQGVHPTCWTGFHLVYASVSLFAFMVYFPMAILSVPVWQQRAKGLTITFPSYFIILVAMVKFLLTWITTAFSTKPVVYLSANFIAAVILLCLSCSLPTRTAASTDLILTKSKVKIGRIASYLAVFLSAISAVVVYKLPSSGNDSTIVVIVLFGVNFLITVASLLLIKFVVTKRFERRDNFWPFFTFTDEDRATKRKEDERKQMKEAEKKEKEKETGESGFINDIELKVQSVTSTVTEKFNSLRQRKEPVPENRNPLYEV